MKKFAKLLVLVVAVALLTVTVTACGGSSNPKPTAQPTVGPTVTPTVAPTVSTQPTVVPTAQPTVTPTVTPTATPTVAPSVSTQPTVVPTAQPVQPTVVPTAVPTAMPTVTPTAMPTPTVAPTVQPTVQPTVTPTASTVNVESITLNSTALFLDIGNTFVLSASVLPVDATDKKVTWVSSNPAVATVTNGTVLALGEGSATITVTAHNGVTAQCTVSVEESEILYSFTPDFSFYVVSGYKGYATSLSIPNIHEGLRVIGITESAFKNNVHLQTITIPDTVESIGTGAFQGCTALKAISLPGSIKVVGASAFQGCTSLKNITFAGVPQIEALETSVFQGCTAIENISLPNSLTTVGIMAFDGCVSLKAITLPQNVTAVSHMAFRDCTALATFRFNEGLKTVGNACFQRCVALTVVELPKSVTSIGASAFSDCSNLQTLRVLGDIETWGNSSFYKCVKLTSVYINSSLTGDLGSDNYIFYDAGIQGAGIVVTVGPNGALPSGLFTPYGNENIPKVTELVFAEGVTAINSQNPLPYLTKVTFPSTITTLAPGLFNNSPGLTQEVLPTTLPAGYNGYGWYKTANYTGETVKTVKNATGTLYFLYTPNTNTLKFNGNGATSGSMANMQINTDATVTLTANAFTRTGYAFKGWSTTANDTVAYTDGASYTMGTNSEYTLYAVWEESFEGIKLTKSGDAYYVSNYTGSSTAVIIHSKYMGYPVTGIGDEAFEDCDSLTEIVIPSSVTSIGSYAFNGCNSLKVVTFGENSQLTSIGSLAFSSCESLTEIVIPESVTSISFMAFYSCDSLTEIVIPSSVTRIGEDAFKGCESLTTVTFGENSQLTSIGDFAFYACDSLTEIVIPESVTSIGDFAFSSCESLTEIKVDASNANYKDIDGNLYSKDGKTLIQYAVGKTATSFTIPKGVTSIGKWAFRDCDSLTKITFSDTTTWYRTKISTDWQNKTGGTQTDVTSPTANATYFKSTYYDYYWYKK